MRLVVFNAVKFCGKFCRIQVERGGERFRDAREFYKYLGALASERGHAHGVPKFGGQPRVGIARHGDVVNIGRRETGFLQTIADGSGGKSGGVFDAIEAFFFDGGDEAAVADDGGGSVAMIGIDAKNVHLDEELVYMKSEKPFVACGAGSRSGECFCANNLACAIDVPGVPSYVSNI